MGKNTNYSKMSTQKFKDQEVPVIKKPTDVEPEETVTLDEACAACEIKLDEPVVDEVPVTPGKVVNCDMLNVREKPNRTAKVLEVISKGALVDVFTTESTNDWYKVNTAEGFVGYCMKEYIKLI